MTALPVETSFQDIDDTYRRLSTSFSNHITRPLEYRTFQLKQLAYLIKDHEEDIFEAIREDLGQGGYAVTIADLYPVYNEIDLAVRRLPTWASEETRFWDSMFAFKFMYPCIKKQPKGVVLIISPWNFPWQLTMVPLVNAIAAGCPAIIKPSELSPTTSALMARLVPQYLDPESYSVVLGGPEQSTHLLKKPWGHILYTGSTRVGKIVAKAAADTLTPTTLELGGKSPTIVSSCADVKITAKRLFTIKQLVMGQMCVTPDYVLCAKERVAEFIAACTETLDTFYPPSPSSESLLHNPMSSNLRSSKDFERQRAFMQDADRQGKLLYKGECDKGSNRMGFSLVLMSEDGVGESGGLVDEEIFGPILPIIPYSTLDAAIEYINARPNPLALYVCSSKRSVLHKVIDHTMSGSVTWNDFAFAVFSRSLPFGGVGQSGWGVYHGYDGFKTFSHFKSTLQCPYYLETLLSLRYPPITPLKQRLLKHLLFAGISFSRPTSLKSEKTKLFWRGWALTGMATLVGVGLIIVQVTADVLGNILPSINCQKR